MRKTVEVMCKPGDKVYYVDHDAGSYLDVIRSAVVEGVEITKDTTIYHLDDEECCSFCDEDFGVFVFLSEEEALEARDMDCKFQLRDMDIKKDLARISDLYKEGALAEMSQIMSRIVYAIDAYGKEQVIKRYS